MLEAWHERVTQRSTEATTLVQTNCYLVEDADAMSVLLCQIMLRAIPPASTDCLPEPQDAVNHQVMAFVRSIDTEGCNLRAIAFGKVSHAI